MERGGCEIMFKAVHKPTGQVVWAWALENDATWIGKEKDEFIAPRYMVYDFEEQGDIKVFFTKTHEREGIQVRCHFKHESTREIYDKESESKEHQMAKEGVYEAICNGYIKLDENPIKDLLKDIQFEYPLSNSKKSKIADVIAIFKEWHPIYGKGIIFEVQLSHQISEITEDRTFNRVAEGYSVCWLWDGDFENNKLKTDKNRINIIPFSKAIEEYQKVNELRSLNKINEAGVFLDKKINSLQYQYKTFLENLTEKSKEVVNSTLNDFELKLEEINVFNKARIIDIKEIIKQEKELDLNNLFKKSISDIEEELKTKIEAEIELIHIDELSNKIIEGTRSEIENKLSLQTINYFPPDWLKNIIKEVTIKKIDESKIKEEIQKQIGEQQVKINLDIINAITCKKCNTLLPIKAVDFEGGYPYCSECFNQLKDNWQKRALKEDKGDDRNTLN